MKLSNLCVFYAEENINMRLLNCVILPIMLTIYSNINYCRQLCHKYFLSIISCVGPSLRFSLTDLGKHGRARVKQGFL